MGEVIKYIIIAIPILILLTVYSLCVAAKRGRDDE